SGRISVPRPRGADHLARWRGTEANWREFLRSERNDCASGFGGGAPEAGTRATTSTAGKVRSEHASALRSDRERAQGIGSSIRDVARGVREQSGSARDML